MKYFRMGWREIMWERSYVNLIMLLATIPKTDLDPVDPKKKKEGQDQEVPSQHAEGIDGLAVFAGLA